ncbi:hypothetical protein [Xanthomonas sp. NCPPB 1128]|uniref:hypothetical protein n=1 Tax=Xanthomonas sp. NCPPB 1128 TaxID=1775876 RepID=UPI00069FDFEA|nr:hypothetical protein [Xanthomonas sp. NCPPB 1128]
MEFPRFFTGVAFVLALAAGGVASTAHADDATTTTTRVVEATYLPGSKEVKQIQQWLLLHSDPTGRMSGDPYHLGTVSVKYTEVISSKASAADAVSAPPPPVPLPASGAPGGTFSVSSCGGGVSQSWSYMWVPNSSGGTWVVTDYHATRTKSCGSSGA